MVTHSSILAWEIPCTEDPGRLQSMGSQGVGHDLITKQQQQLHICVCVYIYIYIHIYIYISKGEECSEG